MKWNRNPEIRKRVTRITAVILILASAVSLTAYFLRLPIPLFPEKTQQEEDRSLPVTPVRIERRDLEDSLETMGTVIPLEKATISSRINGRIVKIFVEEGDSVPKGKPLAALETHQLRLQLKSALAEMRSAEAACRLAREKHSRAGRDVEKHLKTIKKTEIDLRDRHSSYVNMKDILNKKEALFQVGGLSETELSTLKSNYISYLTRFLTARKDYEILKVGYRKKDLRSAGMEASQDKKKRDRQFQKLNTRLEAAEVEVSVNNYKRAVSAVDILKDTLREAVIRSPLTGIVASRGISLGEKVREDSNLFLVIDISKIYLLTDINEKQGCHILPGQEAVYTIDSYPDRSFRGKVRIVSPTLDTGTRTVGIRILSENPGRIVKPGMFARVRIIIRRIPRCLAIPAGCLLDESGNTGHVFLIRKNSVYRQSLRIGKRLGDHYEILSGLKEGDLIASDNLKILKDGMKVVIK